MHLHIISLLHCGLLTISGMYVNNWCKCLRVFVLIALWRQFENIV
jgi:hypothetical protein